MKLAITLSFALAAVMGFAFAQDMGGQDQPMPQAPKPGKHHEHIKAFEGKFDFVAKFMMPDGKTEESKGTQTNTMGCGGLFLIMDASGAEMMGQKFHGHGLWGYDEQKKKYTSVWVDNMADYVQIGEGECSDEGKTITMWVNIKTMEDATKWAKMKEVSKLVDKDHTTLAFSMTGPDGKEMEVGKIEYTRKK